MRLGPLLLAAALLLAACGGADPSVTPSTSAAPSSVAPSPSVEPSGGSPSAAPSPSTPAPTPSPVVGTEYTVQPGDGLAAIARAYGTTVAQLQAWNAERYPTIATNPNAIEPGWVLIVSGDPGVTPLPTPSPPAATPRPTPPPTGGGGCTAGNRVAAGSAQVFRTIPNAGPGVALTFDMGGRMDPAVDIMNFLVANDVCVH